MANFESSIVAYFGGDTTGLNRAIESAEGMVGTLKKSLGALGITIGAVAVKRFFQEVVEKYSQVRDMADALDVSTDAIQAFGYAAKMAGVNAEQTQKMWQTVRKSVDDLAAGTDAAVKQFAVLGLTQKDLIGIPLDAALEKIAKAYVDNKDKAGAYAAMIEIAGGRSARLMSVLEELGVNGSKAMLDLAKGQGQVASEFTINQVDKLGDNWDKIANIFTLLGAGVLGTVVTGFEAVVESWQMMQRFLGQEEDPFNLEGTYDSAKRVKDVMVETAQTTEAVLKEQKKVAEEAKKAADASIKAIISEGEAYRKIGLDKLSTEESIALQKLEIHDLEVAINTAGWTGVELAERKKVLGARRIDLAKDEAKFLEEQIKLGEAEFNQFFDRVDLLQKYLGVEQNGAKERAEQQYLDQKAMRGLTEQESARLQVIELQGKARETIIKMQSILDLPLEKRSLAVNQAKYTKLEEQLETIKKQIIEKAKLAGVVAGEVLPSEKEVTDELERQLALAKAIAEAKTPSLLANLASGGYTKEQLSRASDAELKALIAQYKDKLLDFQISTPSMGPGSLAKVQELAITNPINLSSAELAKRNAIQVATEIRGMEGGAKEYARYGGNILDFESYYASIKQDKTAADTTNNLLKSLSAQLAASGLFPSSPFGV